jgi:hypothetical protein
MGTTVQAPVVLPRPSIRVRRVVRRLVSALPVLGVAVATSSCSGQELHFEGADLVGAYSGTLPTSHCFVNVTPSGELEGTFSRGRGAKMVFFDARRDVPSGVTGGAATGELHVTRIAVGAPSIYAEWGPRSGCDVFETHASLEGTTVHISMRIDCRGGVSGVHVYGSTTADCDVMRP